MAEPNTTLPMKVALALLPTTEKVEARFECRPNTGCSYIYMIERADLAQQLAKALIFQAKPEARRVGYGIYIEFFHKQHGPGLMFFRTAPTTTAN